MIALDQFSNNVDYTNLLKICLYEIIDYLIVKKLYDEKKKYEVY